MRGEAVSIPIAPIRLEHYDEGMIRALGAERRPYVVSGEEAEFYGLFLPGVCGPYPEKYGGAVPVFFGRGRDVIFPSVLPSFVVSRSSIEDDMARVAHVTLAHKVPAFRSRILTVRGPGGQSASGPDLVEERVQAWPVAITYAVQCRARLESEFLRMFHWMLRCFPGQGLDSYITVWDEARSPRRYDAFRESMSDIGEYVDVNDVVRGYEFSVRVEAEIDVEEPTVGRAVLGVQESTSPMEVRT